MGFILDSEFWSIIASIATVLGFGVVIYAAIVALGQLREMTRARHLEALLQVYDMIGSEEARSHRRFIYTDLSSDPEEMTQEEIEIFEQTGVMFDRIGNLVVSGLVPKEELMATHCEIFLRTWMKLEPYIQHYQQLISKRYFGHFEKLFEIAQDYHLKHFPEDEIIVVDVSSDQSNDLRQANGN